MWFFLDQNWSHIQHERNKNFWKFDAGHHIDWKELIEFKVSTIGQKCSIYLHLISLLKRTTTQNYLVSFSKDIFWILFFIKSSGCPKCLKAYNSDFLSQIFKINFRHHECKVQLFWEGHKNVRNRPYGFEIQNHEDDCANFCGLLRKAEL